MLRYKAKRINGSYRLCLYIYIYIYKRSNNAEKIHTHHDQHICLDLKELEKQQHSPINMEFHLFCVMLYAYGYDIFDYSPSIIYKYICHMYVLHIRNPLVLLVSSK